VFAKCELSAGAKRLMHQLTCQAGFKRQLLTCRSTLWAPYASWTDPHRRINLFRLPSRGIRNNSNECAAQWSLGQFDLMNSHLLRQAKMGKWSGAKPGHGLDRMLLESIKGVRPRPDPFDAVRSERARCVARSSLRLAMLRPSPALRGRPSQKGGYWYRA
jgi:hypothetical protein